MGLDLLYCAIGIDLDDGSVSNAKWADPCAGDHHDRIPLTDPSIPGQVSETSVDGPEEHRQIFLAADDAVCHKW